MLGDETSKGERLEIVSDFLDLLGVIQKMSRGLAYETHGESYESVRDLNKHLHRAREKIELIQETPPQLRQRL